jgi:hypothetical protein
MIALSLFIFNTLAFAHPPDDIILNFNAESKTLSIGVAHVVKDSNDHFIKSVVIKVNEKTWITQNFSSQMTLFAQAASYATIDIKKGDVVEVAVICNKTGNLTKKFTIE